MIIVIRTQTTGEEAAMSRKTTDELLKLIEQEKRLDTFFENNSEEFEDTSLSEELARLLGIYNLTKATVIRSSLLDKTYAYQIFDGRKINPSRSKLLAICLGAGFSLRETQRVLRLGHTEPLHPRNRRDCVIIHSINHHISIWKTNEVLFDMKEDLLE